MDEDEIHYFELPAVPPCIKRASYYVIGVDRSDFKAEPDQDVAHLADALLQGKWNKRPAFFSQVVDTIPLGTTHVTIVYKWFEGSTVVF